MNDTSENDFSFWDRGTPAEAAQALVELFGKNALTTAGYWTTMFHGKGNENDYRFWTAVYARILARNVRHIGVAH